MTSLNPFTQRREPAVTVFTKPRCSACLETAAWLSQRGIPFHTVDAGDHRALLVEQGFTEAPVVRVFYANKKSESWQGHRPEKLEKHLGKTQ